MKKLIAVLALAATTLCQSPPAEAQSSVRFPTVAGDTIVNAGTVSKVFTATGAYTGAVVQCVLTKVSGTGAGTVAVLGSLNGADYVAIGSAYTITNTASQTATFYLTNPLPQYIKVLYTGSGTEVVGVSTYYKLPLGH